MTPPLVRSMPGTAAHHAHGVSFALVHRFTPTWFRVEHFRARRSALNACTVAVFPGVPRQNGKVTHPASENRGLNAHVSSAVPFNSLFPHS